MKTIFHFFRFTTACILLIVMQIQTAKAQEFNWVNTMGSMAGDREYARQVLSDNNGNIYVAGSFGYSVDFDPSAGTEYMTASGGSNWAGFIAKYDSLGNFIWSIQMGTSCSDICFDAIGNLCVVGRNYPTSDFDPSANTSTLGINGSYLAKYTTDGNLVWVKGLSNNVNSKYIDVNSSNDIFVHGTFTSTCDFNPDAPVNNLTSFGQEDIFLAKYNSNGGYIWANGFGGSIADYAMNCKFDMDDNICIVGQISSDSVDFDPGSGVQYLYASAGLFYFAKYDLNGGLIWAKNINAHSNSADDCGIDFDTDNNLYITSTFNSTVDFDPDIAVSNLTALGSYDVFLAKYDSIGDYSWAINIESEGMYEKGTDVKYDSVTNTILLAGCIDSLVDFDPSAGVASFNAGIMDAFFAKYDLNGNYLFAKVMDGGGCMYASRQRASMAIGNSGNIIFSGTFGSYSGSSASCDFDPSAGSAVLTATNNFDVFVASYNNTGNYSWAKSLESATGGNDYAKAVCNDFSDNIYVAGSFADIVDFNPDILAEYNLSAISSSDAFIAKYDSSGVLIWARNVGGTGSFIVADMAIDASGQLCLVGSFFGSADFDPAPSVVNHTSNGSSDIFILCLDTNGNYLWSNTFGGIEGDYGDAIAIDTSGNIVISGRFLYGPIDMEPGAGTNFLYDDGWSGCTNSFVAKYNSNGDFIWVNNTGCDKNWVSIKSDNQCNILVAGDEGGQAVVYSKYNSSGTMMWNKYLGNGFGVEFGELEIDTNGDLLMIGTFFGIIDMDPGAPVVSLFTAGSRDVFLGKYNSNGDYIWGERLGSNKPTNDEWGYSIAIDENNNFTISGIFSDTVDFDLEAIVNNMVGGYGSKYIVEYNSSGSLLWVKCIVNGGSTGKDNLLVDYAGNTILAGSYSGTTAVDFNSGSGVELRTSNGQADIFILKLSNDTIITISPCPNPDVCLSDTIFLSVSASGGTQPYTYAWTGPSGWNSSLQNPEIFNAQPSNAGMYYITVTDSLGVFGSDSVLVTVHSNPPVVLSATADTLLCSNDQIQLYANGAVDYVWSHGLGIGISHLVVPGATTTYSVTGTDAFGCSAADSIEISVVDINTSVTVVEGTITAIQNGAFYQWLDCGNAYSQISGATDQFYSALIDGSYAVEITLDGCLDTSSCIDIVVSGIETGNKEESFLLWPNPSNGMFYIELPEDAVLKIWDMDGAVVYESTLSSGRNAIAKTGLNAGLYNVVVFFSTHTHVEQLLIVPAPK